jgi:hypothetical protein
MKLKQKELLNPFLFFITQGILITTLRFIANLQGKALVFYSSYYYILLFGSLVYLGILYFTISFTQKRKIILFVGLGLVFLFISYLLRDFFLPLLQGMGSIENAVTIAEMNSLSFPYLWNQYWILLFPLLFGFLGLKWRSQTFFLLGWLLPVLYMNIFAVRYSFLAAFPLSILIALFFSKLENPIFDSSYALLWVYAFGILSFRHSWFLLLIPLAGILIWKLKWKNTLIILSLILMTHYSFATFERLELLDGDMKEILDYVKENTSEDSCIVSHMKYGGLIQYYTGRHTYTSSVSFDTSRWEDYYRYLFTNSTWDLEGEYYLLFDADDIRMFFNYNHQIGLNGSILAYDFELLEKELNPGYTLDIYQDDVGNQIGIAYNKTDKSAFLIDGDNRLRIKEFYDINTLYSSESGFGYLVSYPELIYLGERLANANVIPMINSLNSSYQEIVLEKERKKIIKIS